MFPTGPLPNLLPQSFDHSLPIKHLPIFNFGSLGFDVRVNASFDILTSLTGDTNVGVLVDGNTAYQIDLTTGQATRLGSLGTQLLKGFAIALVPDLTASGDDQLFGGNGNGVIRLNRLFILKRILSSLEIDRAMS
jgi:hypothetical protein